MSCKCLQKHHCGVYLHKRCVVPVLEQNITSQYIFEMPQVTNEKKIVWRVINIDVSAMSQQHKIIRILHKLLLQFIIVHSPCWSL